MSLELSISPILFLLASKQKGTTSLKTMVEQICYKNIDACYSPQIGVLL